MWSRLKGDFTRLNSSLCKTSTRYKQLHFHSRYSCNTFTTIKNTANKRSKCEFETLTSLLFLRLDEESSRHLFVADVTLAHLAALHLFRRLPLPEKPCSTAEWALHVTYHTHTCQYTSQLTNSSAYEVWFTPSSFLTFVQIDNKFGFFEERKKYRPHFLNLFLTRRRRTVT